VTVCFTGTPTSTFGGGGGTKLFCSHALKVTNADKARATRQTAMAFRLALPFNLMPVSECVGFIPAPQLILFWRRLFGETLFRLLMNSNNSLAVKPERENDRIAKIFCRPLLNISRRLKRRLQRDNAKDFFK